MKRIVISIAFLFAGCFFAWFGTTLPNGSVMSTMGTIVAIVGGAVLVYEFLESFDI